MMNTTSGGSNGQTVVGGDESVEPQAIGRGYEDIDILATWSNSDARAMDRPASATSNVRMSCSQNCLVHTKFTCRVLVKLAGASMMAMVLVIVVINWPPWVIDDAAERGQVMSALFAMGLFMVAVEEFVAINKSAIMLLLAAMMWALLAAGYHPTKSQAGFTEFHEELNHGLQDVGSVILFLLPAMGVVEAMDHFDGFAAVTVAIRRLTLGHKRRLMPIICFFTFFLSSVIDNLTSTIVALKILRHVVPDDEEYRKVCGGLAVMAANAGGAWSPVGDVTTTMLWIQAKITAPATVAWLLLPSAVAGILPLAGLWWQLAREEAAGAARDVATPPRRRGERELAEAASGRKAQTEQQEQEHEPLRFQDCDEHLSEELTFSSVVVLVFGILSILLVPALKLWIGLPPYLGMLLALGAVWLFTDSLVAKREALQLASHSGPPQSGVVAALHKVDLTGLLFFAGVLLAVGALDSAGVLDRYAAVLVKLCGSNTLALCTLLGLSSAVVDNVPLVEAAIDMFNEVPADDALWQLVALAAGTGGSILSIGSIAGVTLMSMDSVSFLWYFRRIGPWALVGFFLGMLTYQLERLVTGL